MKKLAATLALAAFALTGSACEYEEVLEAYNPDQINSPQQTCPPKRASKPFSKTPRLSCQKDPIPY